MIKRYLGIDYGTVRIGLALGDSVMKIAIPFGVVANIDELIEVIKKEDIDELVVGLPMTMKSEVGPMSAAVNEFIKHLEVVVDLPISILDERLTSKAADALPGDKKTKADRDALAAMLILQTYLDKM